jgi:mRNA-degrading endonuclease RelE of RelBE toxin-antitoxin system
MVQIVLSKKAKKEFENIPDTVHADVVLELLSLRKHSHTKNTLSGVYNTVYYTCIANYTILFMTKKEHNIIYVLHFYTS